MIGKMSKVDAERIWIALSSDDAKLRAAILEDWKIPTAVLGGRARMRIANWLVQVGRALVQEGE